MESWLCIHELSCRGEKHARQKIALPTYNCGFHPAPDTCQVSDMEGLKWRALAGSNQTGDLPSSKTRDPVGLRIFGFHANKLCKERHGLRVSQYIKLCG